MILINIKTNEAYSNVWIAEAARKIGISPKQIGRWIKNNKYPIEKFNNWILYFNEERLTKNTGFKLKCPSVSHQ